MSETANTFKLLWKMYDELLKDRNSSSVRDNSGTIISRYAYILDGRIKQQTLNKKDALREIFINKEITELEAFVLAEEIFREGLNNE